MALSRMFPLVWCACLVTGCSSGSVDEDVCLGINCSGHGQCVPVDGLPTCDCEQGYHPVGITCEVDPVDPCAGVSCSGHGGCRVISGRADCDCDTGYHAEGLTCVEDGTTGPCLGVDCSGHGGCIESGGVAECHCDPGYHPEDLSCVIDPTDPCQGVDCSGHGTCQAPEGQAECVCESGFHPQGLECLADADPCAGVNCSGHGTCVAAGGLASCQCDTGYHAEGLACVADAVDPCLGVDCGPYGTCQAQNGTASCLCDEGYEPDGLTCVETLCACRERTRVPTSSCVVRQQCNSDADCCPTSVPAPMVCNVDYPYLYSCVAGLCESRSCTQDAECLRYVDLINASGGYHYASFGCRALTDECTGTVTRYCDLRQTCSVPADCCPASLGDAFDCLVDYPYLFTCEAGACVQQYCSADAQCDALYSLYAGSNPAGWVNDGCDDVVDPCTDEVWYSLCQIAQVCATAADCCPNPMPAGYTCLADFPYLYTCDAGRCRSLQCTSSSQCLTYYQQSYGSNTGYVNQGCVTN